MKRKRKSQKTRDKLARNYAECIISVHLRNCEEQGSEQLRKVQDMMMETTVGIVGIVVTIISIIVTLISIIQSYREHKHQKSNRTRQK